jgi:hypothetical protein
LWLDIDLLHVEKLFDCHDGQLSSDVDGGLLPGP